MLHTKLGAILQRLKRYGDAMEHFRLALRFGLQFPSTMHTLYFVCLVLHHMAFVSYIYCLHMVMCTCGNIDSDCKALLYASVGSPR